MSTPIGNMRATFANTSIRYDAIGMDVNASSFDANSRLISIKTSGNTKFDIDVNGTVQISNTITLFNTRLPWMSTSTIIGVGFKSNIMYSGIVVEQSSNADILSIVINSRQVGNIAQSYVGGIIRLDTRVNERKFVVFGTNVGNGSIETEHLTVKLNTGNVGLGISNPQNKLDVNGAVNAAGFLVNGSDMSGRSIAMAIVFG